LPFRESPHLREIRSLDPEQDCRRIVFLDTFHEFPFDTTRALELAFLKTFAVPSIAALLDSTCEFGERGQKPYDDTDLLISAFSEDGWDGPLGKRAVRRMNQIHGRFRDFERGLRGRALRLLPPRRRPKLRTALSRRSYPAGYSIEELGPPPASALR
jgi:hypothetical protein